MHARLAMTALRVLTWSGVVLLAVLSLLPEQTLGAYSSVDVIRMVRAIVSAPIEHFLAYAGMAALSMAVYGSARSGMRIIGCLWVYGGILERAPLLARPASVGSRFRGGSTRGALRRPCRRPPLASPPRSSAMKDMVSRLRGHGRLD